MKQAIRALGFSVYILWLVVIVFTVTAVYSAFQLGIDFGEEPRTSVSERTMMLSLPFSIVNNGFYDIYDLNISTMVQERNGALVSNSSTFVPLISRGNKIDTTHNVSVSLWNMTSASLSRLLFNDSNFDFDMSLALRYAGVIPLRISTNFTMQWRAPLYNLALGEVTLTPFNSTHATAILPLSFENNAFFNLNGTIRTELIDALNQQVGATTTPINVEPESGYSTNLEVLVPVSASDFKEAHLYFDTSFFSYGPKVMPLG